jgi:hypothetical protein
MIQFDRIFSMPNKNTFKMKPAKDFIYAYLGKTNRTYDPFCGASKIAVFRNDIALTGIDSKDWLESIDDNSAELVLFDPPYTPRQLKECYNSMGVSLHDTKPSVWKIWKNEIARITEPGGVVLSFGNNSMGIGKKKWFSNGTCASYPTRRKSL